MPSPPADFTAACHGDQKVQSGCPWGLGKCSSVASSQQTRCPENSQLIGGLTLRAWGVGLSWAPVQLFTPPARIMIKPPLLGAPGPELGSMAERRLSQDWGVGRSTSEPGVFQGVTMGHVRKGGDHQSVVRGLWWGFRVPPGFQKCQREKQTEVSLPSRNKREVRGQEGQGGRRTSEGAGWHPWALTGPGKAGILLSQHPAPQPSLPIDHT